MCLLMLIKNDIKNEKNYHKTITQLRDCFEEILKNLKHFSSNSSKAL